MNSSNTHIFDINLDEESEASVSILEIYDQSTGQSIYELTVTEGELIVDEDELKDELVELIETESDSGETTINVSGENLFILYDIRK